MFTQGPLAGVGGVLLQPAASLSDGPEAFQASIIGNNLESSHRPEETAGKVPLAPPPLQQQMPLLFSVASLSQ